MHQKSIQIVLTNIEYYDIITYSPEGNYIGGTPINGQYRGKTNL